VRPSIDLVVLEWQNTPFDEPGDSERAVPDPESPETGHAAAGRPEIAEAAAGPSDEGSSKMV